MILSVRDVDTLRLLYWCQFIKPRDLGGMVTKVGLKNVLSTKKEMDAFLEVGKVAEVKGMMLGKIKKRPDDPDKYALCAAHRMVAGDNNNLLCIGAPAAANPGASSSLSSWAVPNEGSPYS